MNWLASIISFIFIACGTPPKQEAPIHDGTQSSKNEDSYAAHQVESKGTLPNCAQIIDQQLFYLKSEQLYLQCNGSKKTFEEIKLR